MCFNAGNKRRLTFATNKCNFSWCYIILSPLDGQVSDIDKSLVLPYCQALQDSSFRCVCTSVKCPIYLLGLPMLSSVVLLVVLLYHRTRYKPVSVKSPRETRADAAVGHLSCSHRLLLSRKWKVGCLRTGMAYYRGVKLIFTIPTFIQS